MATIYYWSMKDGNVGHLSMSLDDDDGTYISHWPDGGAKPFDRKMDGHAVPTLQDDIKAEGNRQPEIIKIPKEMIDVARIKEQWKEYKGSSYQLLFSNCCQMVESLLRRGGFSKYESVRHSQSAYFLTPYEVFNWVRKCKERYELQKDSVECCIS